MSIVDLNAKHAGMAREAVRRLAEGGVLLFKLIDIADMCFTAGLFNEQEKHDLFKRALFPAWFLDELRNVLPRTMELSNLTANNCDTVPLGEAGELALTSPAAQSASWSISKNFSSRSERMPEMYVVRGNHATHYVSHWLNVSWSNDGVIGPRKDQSARFFINFLQDAQPQNLPGRTFLGVVRGSNGYAHWLLETFPKLLALIEAGEDIDKIDQFVFLNASENFHKGTLKELGIGPERVIATKIRQERIFNTEEFSIVSDLRVNRVASVNVYDMICSFFGLPRDNRPGKRKLFISRSKAIRRRIINEDEVFAFLEPFGYELVRMEDFDVRQTARMMAEAKAIIAPHGAGLANIVFASPGTKVLEMFNAQYTNGYWKIANQKNLQYYVFEADGPNGQKLDPEALKKLNFAQRQLDMTVSMKEFKDFVENEFERE